MEKGIIKKNKENEGIPHLGKAIAIPCIKRHLFIDLTDVF